MLKDGLTLTRRISFKWNFIILLSFALQKCSGVWALFIFSALNFFNRAYLSTAISFVHGMSQFCAGPYSTSIWNTGSKLTDPYELLSQTLLLHLSVCVEMS